MSEHIADLATALSAAQGELEAVHKDQTGYGYKYSSLNETIQIIKPTLVKHGLAITQLVGIEEGRPSVTTILLHKSGQWIKSYASLPLVEMKGINEAQRAGAVFSYLRRYAIQAILNISSDDSDAATPPQVAPTRPTKTTSPGEFKMPFGKTKGQRLQDLGPENVKSALEWIEQNIQKPSGHYADFIKNAKGYLSE